MPLHRGGGKNKGSFNSPPSSQNHGMGQGGRSHSGAAGPTSLLHQSHPRVQDCVQTALDIPSFDTPHPPTICSVLSHCTGRKFCSMSSEPPFIVPHHLVEQKLSLPWEEGLGEAGLSSSSVTDKQGMLAEKSNGVWVHR